MKFKDPHQWQLALSDLAKDPDPLAQQFKNFVICWAEAAEQELTEPEHYHPVAALRATLAYAQVKYGPLTIGHVGQALVFLAAHWEPAGTPDEFLLRMTTIEQNLYMDIVTFKKQLLEEQAENQAIRDGLDL